MPSECVNEWINPVRMGFNTKSIYFNRKSFPNKKRKKKKKKKIISTSETVTSSLVFYIYSLMARSLSSSHFQKARGQQSSSYNMLYRFHLVLFESHTHLPPYNLEDTSAIICAFLMFSSSPPPGPHLNSAFWVVSRAAHMSGITWIRWDSVYKKAKTIKDYSLSSSSILKHCMNYFLSIPWVYHSLLESKTFNLTDLSVWPNVVVKF